MPRCSPLRSIATRPSGPAFTEIQTLVDALDRAIGGEEADSMKS
jgi:hypothetical protein